jgi:hypothetical protein
VVSILGSAEGVTRAANEAEGVEIFVGAVDKELGGSGGGMIVPGLVLLRMIRDELLMGPVLEISETVSSSPSESKRTVLMSHVLYGYLHARVLYRGGRLLGLFCNSEYIALLQIIHRRLVHATGDLHRLPVLLPR